MSQFLNLLKGIGKGDNLPLLSSLAEPVKDKITEAIGGNIENLVSSPPGVAEKISEEISEKAPVLSNSMLSVSKLYRWRAVIIIALVVWAIFMVVSRIFVKDEEARGHIETTNNLLLGNNGILLLIGLVWFGSLVLIALVPAFIAITPKLENILGTVGTALSTFTGGKLA